MMAAGTHSGAVAGYCHATVRNHNVTYSAGPAASLKWPPSDIRHCEWVPACAGMKRSGGDAGSTDEKVLNSNKRLIHEEVRRIRRDFCAHRQRPMIFKMMITNSLQRILIWMLYIPGTAGLLALLGSTYLVPDKNQKSAMPSQARLCPGTAGPAQPGLWHCLGRSILLRPTTRNQQCCVQTQLCRKKFLGKGAENPFLQKGVFRKLLSFLSFPFFILFLFSRSGRRGRMRRHMRDNMASRADRPGNLSVEGGRCQSTSIICNGAQNKGRRESAFPPYKATCLRCCVFNADEHVQKSFAEDLCPPLSSPGVCSTNPPAKPTDVFYKPNRQWCGARRGGGEGSPRARVSCVTRVSFEQHGRSCRNSSAILSSIAVRQQQERPSAHRRAASRMARTRASRLRDMLEMRKRYDFHPGEAQQNMGTGNALSQRCLYPFLRPLESFNRSATPFCKTVRAGGAI